MMLVFIALIPIMVLASSLPAVILSLFQSSILNQIPGVAQILNNGLVLSLASMVGGVLVGWILFQAIYMVVPNQRISIKNSWRGALTSAVLLELFLILFPFYVTHFMKSYTGVVGFGVIFLLFFYYFAVILLFGAEVNAYFAEHVAPLPGTLATILRQAVGNPTEPAEPEKLLQAAGATASQTDTDTNASRLTQDASSQTQEKQADVSNSARQTVQEMTPKEQEEKQADKSSSAPQTVPQKASETQENKPSLFSRRKKRARKAAKPAKTRRTGELIEAVAGTILAFAATLIRQRRKAEH
jgi:hypothetical protein